ncbi:PREDICTED: uncharacterized protein LOC109183496 [Ipomoea nil]|uniref:uncharacterized protein LOC109183496 n=1 Tax=Ipomoea nil TaxID=35883 RepID=UPI000900DB1B|nr:PREDICTED: uncharacterized protein LOC109183496 [Ipomoea nil]
MGGKIDKTINNGSAPPTFRLHGQNFHLMVSLLPESGERPKFSQLYIYYTQNEINNRLSELGEDDSTTTLHYEIVKDITDALDENKVLVKSFRIAKMEMESNPRTKIKIKLIGRRNKDAKTYNLPQVGEVAALIVGDLDPNMGNEIFWWNLKLRRHKVKFSNVEGRSSNAGSKLSPREYFSFSLQDRFNEISTLLYSRRLFQQYLVDAYTMIESGRLWLEIERFLQPRKLKAEDRPDIICRVFKMKLNALIKEIQKEKIFGVVDAVIYTIEFQKRGLPHAHILIFLSKNNSYPNPKDIDMIISVEIPSQLCDPGEEEFTLHGQWVTAEFYNSAVEESTGKVIDEIKMYYDCRYISPCEAAWRIFAFDIQFRNPCVERLSFHLPNEHSVIFHDDDLVDDVVNQPTVAQSMFTAWFEANKKYAEGRQLTYSQMPTKFVWKNDKREWHPMQRDWAIGRIFYVPPNSDAFYARSLIEDDKEYVNAINEAVVWSSAHSLRELFVTLLTSNSMSKPENVWELVWNYLSDDAEFISRRNLSTSDLILNESQKRNYALLEMEKLLNAWNKSLADYPPMPMPDENNDLFLGNRLLFEEISYDREALMHEHNSLLEKLTDEQLVIYNKVIADVETEKGGMYFVYGYGGIGKTFLWKTLLATLRSKGEVVLNVASSGISSLLLPGGRTAHSRNSRSSTMNFGGKTIVLGGDFRQILPVIPKVLRLTKNLRLRGVTNEKEVEKLDGFAKWIADLGDGKLGEDNGVDCNIMIPSSFVLENEGDPIRQIVDNTFPEYRSGNMDERQLDSRAILAPTLDVVDKVNEYMNGMNQASSITYMSCDSVCKSETNVDMQSEVQTTEFLNSLRCSGVPNHCLTLKVGTPVMLLRNIDRSLGLCNGTRLIVTQLGNHVIEAQILCGNNAEL